MQNMQAKMGKRLVFFPMPFVGHQNTILGLARVLHSKGFSISVISTRLHAPIPSKYPHFSFHLIDDGLSESEASIKDVLAQAKLLNMKCVEPFKACMSQILSDSLDQEPIACIIADAMWHFSQAAADELKVPRITLKTGNITLFTAFFVNPFLREMRHLSLRDKDPEDLIPELSPLRVKDLPRPPKLDQSPLEDMQPNLLKATKASKGLIFNSFEELESPSLDIARKECPIPVFAIGPFHKYLQPPPSTVLSDQDQTILSWLDTQPSNSVLYVSFGSLATVNQDWFLEVAWGLANSKQPFIWVVRSDLVHGSNKSLADELLKDFLKEVSGKGHVISWAPQREVLAHSAVGGFWTHCGWNSTLESIGEGVPMICTPSFGDQMLNARYVSIVWKIGVELDKKAKREDVEKAIRKLMTEKEGEEIRERSVLLKRKTIECLQLGGSSYKYMEDLIDLIMSL